MNEERNFIKGCARDMSDCHLKYKERQKASVRIYHRDRQQRIKMYFSGMFCYASLHIFISFTRRSLIETEKRTDEIIL